MSEELQQSADGLSNDGGAEVTNVHLLGNVRRGEIHNHPQLLREGRGAHSVNHKVRDQLGDKGWLQRNVDKARTCYFTAGYELLVVADVRGDLSSHVSRGNTLTLPLQQLIKINML